MSFSNKVPFRNLTVHFVTVYIKYGLIIGIFISRGISRIVLSGSTPDIRCSVVIENVRTFRLCDWLQSLTSITRSGGSISIIQNRLYAVIWNYHMAYFTLKFIYFTAWYIMERIYVSLGLIYCRRINIDISVFITHEHNNNSRVLSSYKLKYLISLPR